MPSTIAVKSSWRLIARKIKDDFLVSQQYPAAVNFIHLARYLAELAYKDSNKRSLITQAISGGEQEKSATHASSSGDPGSNRNMLIRLVRQLPNEQMESLLQEFELSFCDDRGITGTRQLQVWLNQEIDRRGGVNLTSRSEK